MSGPGALACGVWAAGVLMVWAAVACPVAGAQRAGAGGGAGGGASPGYAYAHPAPAGLRDELVRASAALADPSLPPTRWARGVAALVRRAGAAPFPEAAQALDSAVAALARPGARRRLASLDAGTRRALGGALAALDARDPVGARGYVRSLVSGRIADVERRVLGADAADVALAGLLGDVGRPGAGVPSSAEAWSLTMMARWHAALPPPAPRGDVDRPAIERSVRRARGLGRRLDELWTHADGPRLHDLILGAVFEDASGVLGLVFADALVLAQADRERRWLLREARWRVGEAGAAGVGAAAGGSVGHAQVGPREDGLEVQARVSDVLRGPFQAIDGCHDADDARARLAEDGGGLQGLPAGGGDVLEQDDVVARFERALQALGRPVALGGRADVQARQADGQRAGGDQRDAPQLGTGQALGGGRCGLAAGLIGGPVGGVVEEAQGALAHEVGDRSEKLGPGAELVLVQVIGARAARAEGERAAKQAGGGDAFGQCGVIKPGVLTGGVGGRLHARR